MILKKKNNSDNKILLVGGEGYIGRVVSKYLINKNFKVTSADNLIYSKNKIRPKSKGSYRFLYYDLRYDKLNLSEFSCVIILAGLVGDPITKKYPKLSTEINLIEMKKLINDCFKSNIKKLIYISTCSNYGVYKKNKKPTENSPLKPLSLYSKHKVEIEKFILKNKFNKSTKRIILRFATAFGVSPRMRFDLTINQFVKEFFLKRKINVYDPLTWRPYCHVLDFAMAMEKVIRTIKIKDKSVFNVGSNQNNLTKIDILNKINQFIPNMNYSIQKKASPDKRDYNVNFNKIEKVLKFKTSFDCEYGIKEIISYIKKKNKTDKLGNFKIYKN